MTDEPSNIDSYDGDEDDDTGQPFVFAKANKYVQIVVVGLLIGGALFGFYLIGLGAFNMIDSPIPVTNGTLDSKYPISYTDSYYKSDKRNELYVFNNKELFVKTLFIGTPEEYSAWNDMKLMDSNDNFYVASTDRIDPGKIKYRAILRYYGKYETLTDQFNGYSTTFIIVYDNDKSTMEKYTATIKGNQTHPEFTIIKI